jgi:hypothetical protein
MKNKDKTKEQLISELEEMRRRVTELEKPDQAEGQYREIVELSPDGIITEIPKGTAARFQRLITLFRFGV